MRRLFSRFLAHRKRFTAEVFRGREKFRADYRLLAEALERQLSFASVLDIGCANGFLIDAFHATGREVAGVELSPEVLEVLPEALRARVTVGDFSVAHGSFDLVCCLEVAEHIAPERSVELVETVCRCARAAIYFTAAPPGQSGRGHINCRPHTEWIGWFALRGWVVDTPRTTALRRDLERLELATWLGGNSFVLVRSEG